MLANLLDSDASDVKDALTVNPKFQHSVLHSHIDGGL